MEKQDVAVAHCNYYARIDDALMRDKCTSYIRRCERYREYINVINFLSYELYLIFFTGIINVFVIRIFNSYGARNYLINLSPNYLPRSQYG